VSVNPCNPFPLTDMDIERITRKYENEDNLHREAIYLLRGFQTEIKVDQLRMWLAGSGQLERIVELLKRTEKLLKEVAS